MTSADGDDAGTTRTTAGTNGPPRPRRTAGRPVPGGRTRRPALAVVVLVALVVAVLLVPAALVRISSGPSTWWAAGGTAGGPLAPDVEFVDPPSSQASAVYTFVNDGPLSVRVDTLAEYPDGVVVELLAYPARRAGGDAVFDPEHEPGVASLRVGAGETFGVRYVQNWPECVPFEPGSGLGMPALELRVTTLVVPRAVTVLLEPGVVLTTQDGRLPADTCGTGTVGP